MHFSDIRCLSGDIEGDGARAARRRGCHSLPYHKDEICSGPILLQILQKSVYESDTPKRRRVLGSMPVDFSHFSAINLSIYEIACIKETLFPPM